VQNYTNHLLYLHVTNWRQYFMRLSSVIDHEFHHNIVTIAVDPRGDSRVDSQTTLTMLWQNSLSITEQMHLFKNWHQFVFYDNKLSNFPLSFADASYKFQIHMSVRILTIKFSQWARINFCSYRKNFNQINSATTTSCKSNAQQVFEIRGIFPLLNAFLDLTGNNNQSKRIFCNIFFH